MLTETASPRVAADRASPPAASAAATPWPSFEGQLQEVDELLYAEIAEHRARPDLEERDDILSMLMLAEFEDGGRWSDNELRDQLMTLLLAGHETTATALAWTFDLLLRHPERAAAPARLAGGGRGRLPAGDDLRVAAPAPGDAAGRPPPRHRARRSTASTLPAGTDVTAGDLAHPHPRRPLPRAASPSGPSASSSGGPDTYAWIPFGGGIRRCLGAAFAEFEMRIVLREVLTRCDLRKAEPAAGEDRPPQHHPLAQGRHPGRGHRPPPGPRAAGSPLFSA